MRYVLAVVGPALYVVWAFTRPLKVAPREKREEETQGLPVSPFNPIKVQVHPRR